MRQPQLAQRADHRQEVIEVALQIVELAPLGGGQALRGRLRAEQQHGVPAARLGVEVEVGRRGCQLLGDAPVEAGQPGGRPGAAHVHDLAGRQELHVGDGVDARRDAVLDGRGGAGMGDGPALQGMGALHRHAELLDGVGREVRDAAPGPAAGGDHLDHVGALGDEAPHLAADLLQRVGDAAEAVEVPPDVGDRPAGKLEARPGKIPAVDRLADGKHRAAAGAAVADGGDAGLEVTGQLAHRSEGEHLVRLGEARFQVPPVRRERGMGVDVHESGQQEVLREVEAGRRRPGHRADRGDPAVLDPHDRVVDRGAAPAVDQRSDPQGEWVASHADGEFWHAGLHGCGEVADGADWPRVG